jgi:photosystem II stability/assembly factor-like uncharacterized protein/molybdopterin converting factor small subunit
MPTVRLRSPLRELAGGGSLEVDGTTVAEVVRRLETEHPRLVGWILDERGSVRSHVALFVNGARVEQDTPVGPRDRVDVLGAISGGAEEPAEILIGTAKGLVILRGDRGGGPMDVVARRFSGVVVEYATRDPRTGTYLASVTHGQYGPRLFMTDDPLAERWDQAKGPAFPEDAGDAVERIWTVVPAQEEGVLWAGVAPAALFRSEDGGRSWSLNRALWDRPERASWEPGAGGLCLHSICTWPGDPERLAVGISAAGVWLTEDRGRSWRTGFDGLVPRYLPEEARETSSSLCVHNVHRSPIPERLYLQFHGGVYRSDDSGESWSDIGSDGGLPSDFGFPLVAHPRDPDRAYVIPLRGDFDRVTPNGNVAVYETADGGGAWTALTDGLPQGDAYLTILRQAFDHDGRDPLGLYFGAESGEVFCSADGGKRWTVVADHLPPVTSVRFSR